MEKKKTDLKNFLIGKRKVYTMWMIQGMVVFVYYTSNEFTADHFVQLTKFIWGGYLGANIAAKVVDAIKTWRKGK